MVSMRFMPIILAIACALINCGVSEAASSIAANGKLIQLAILSYESTIISNPPIIGKILILNGSALADRNVGEDYGESLLVQNGNQWNIVSSGSHGPIDSEKMHELGVDAVTAKAIDAQQGVPCASVGTSVVSSGVAAICYNLEY